MFKFARLVSHLTLAAVIAAVSCSLVFSPKAHAVALTPKNALIYGDSLMYESKWEIDAQFKTKSGWNYHEHTFPGIALCDMLSYLPADLATYHPSVVVLETAGNFTRPCMLDANGNQLVDGSPEYLAKYTSDMTSFFNQVTATGAQVLFVQGPPWKNTVRNNSVTQINNIATNLSANYGDRAAVTNVPRNAVSSSGKYTDYKPCLSTETAAMGCGAQVAGQIAIRTLAGTQTGIHFCPDGLQAAYPYGCAMYSSGEFRFGQNVVNQIVSKYVTPTTPVVTYGNTLTWESTQQINNFAAQKNYFKLTTRSFPNTGLCTWNSWLTGDISTYHPWVIGLESMTMPPDATGVDSTCGKDASGNTLVLGSPEYYAAFQANLAKFFQTAQDNGIKVVYFETIPVKDPARNAILAQQNAIAKTLAATYHGISYSTALSSKLSNSGKYTDYKPCLSTETAAMGCGAQVAGQIAIRTLTAPVQAGNHLCPDGLPATYPWYCATYSSGEYRFGQALVGALYNPPAPILP